MYAEEPKEYGTYAWDRFRSALGPLSLGTHVITVRKFLQYLGPTGTARFVANLYDRRSMKSQITLPDLHISIPRRYALFVFKEFANLRDEGWQIFDEGSSLRFENGSTCETIAKNSFSTSFLYRLRLIHSGWWEQGGRITNGDVDFDIKDNLAVVYETFQLKFYDCYPSLTGRMVFDVGANVGDTAIWFAKKGAHVEAFEPVPWLYDRALVNIRKNGVESRVNLHRLAVGPDSSRKKVLIEPEPHIIDAGAGDDPIRAELVEFDTVRLSDAVKGMDPFVLKMDCEGCEYGMILGDYAGVRAFSNLVMEWHEYITRIPVSRLLARVLPDFEVKLVYGQGQCTDPNPNRVWERRAGMIFASRRRDAHPSVNRASS